MGHWRNHREAVRTESTWTPVSKWRWISNLDLWVIWICLGQWLSIREESGKFFLLVRARNVQRSQQFAQSVWYLRKEKHIFGIKVWVWIWHCRKVFEMDTWQCFCQAFVGLVYTSYIILCMFGQILKKRKQFEIDPENPEISVFGTQKPIEISDTCSSCFLILEFFNSWVPGQKSPLHPSFYGFYSAL